MMDDGHTAISGGADNLLKVTNITTQINIIERKVNDIVVSLCLSKDREQSYLFTAGKDNEIHVYFTKTWVHLC